MAHERGRATRRVHGGVGSGDMAHQREHQPQRVLGGRDGVARGGVDDGDAGLAAASRSMLSTPTPARPMTTSREPAAMASVDLDCY